MPRSTAASTVLRSARAPSRCPSPTGRPRADAQRPFPSMMIATLRASSEPWLADASVISYCLRRSDFHDLGLFHLQEVVDRLRVVVGDLLHLLLGAALLVVADLAVDDEFLEVLHDVTPDVANGHFAVFRDSSHDLHEILAPLFGESG